MRIHKMKALSIAGVLALSLAACGGGDDSESPEDDTTTSSSPEESDNTDDSSEADDSDEDGSDEGSESEEGNGSEETTSPDIDLATDETPISAQDALDISAAEVGDEDDSIVHAIKLKYSDSLDAWEWSVKTFVEGENNKVKINADTGEITKHETDSTDDVEKRLNLDDPMDFDEAKRIALDLRQGRIVSWKYEWDDNRFEYQFDIEVDGTTEEVEIDAETGEAELD